MTEAHYHHLSQTTEAWKDGTGDISKYHYDLSGINWDHEQVMFFVFFNHAYGRQCSSIK